MPNLSITEAKYGFCVAQPSLDYKTGLTLCCFIVIAISPVSLTVLVVL